MINQRPPISAPVLFGLDEASVRILRGFSKELRPAEFAEAIKSSVDRRLQKENHPPLEAPVLITLLASCPAGIGKPMWEAHWNNAWKKLNKQGTSGTWLLALANATLEATVSHTIYKSKAAPALQAARIKAMLKAIFVLLNEVLVDDIGVGASELQELQHHYNRVISIPNESACITQITRWQQNKHNVSFGILVCTLIQRRLLSQMILEVRERLMTTISSRLRQTLRPQDRIFKGENWEWLFLIPYTDTIQIRIAAQRIHTALSEPLRIMGRDIKISEANGVALYPEHGREAEVLIRAARIAAWTYVSDDRKKQTEILIRATHFDPSPLIDSNKEYCCAWYSPETDQSAISRIALRTELGEALAIEEKKQEQEKQERKKQEQAKEASASESQSQIDLRPQVANDEYDSNSAPAELTLNFQPQIDLRTDRPVGAEALLRWHSQGEWVSPMLIIEMIEDLGKRQVFTTWLAHSAVRACRTFLDEGIMVNLSINLTVHDLLDKNLPTLLKNILDVSKINPEMITLELTESTLMNNFERGIKTMHELRKLGFSLALDDFGTGYSSLSYLHRLPIQKLKIDHSFVSRITESEANLEIVRTMVTLAHKLGLVVIAEGAESIDTRTRLVELGCEYGQGFFHSRPLSEKKFLIWWKARTANLDHHARIPDSDK